MISYTFWLKHLVILDVFAISAGFVLRAAGGAVRTRCSDQPVAVCLHGAAVAVSSASASVDTNCCCWNDAAAEHRRNLDEYSVDLLDQLIRSRRRRRSWPTRCIRFRSSNLPENHSMMLTIPFVLYAIFRYLFLIHRRDGGGSPEQLLLTDGRCLRLHRTMGMCWRSAILYAAM